MRKQYSCTVTSVIAISQLQVPYLGVYSCNVSSGLEEGDNFAAKLAVVFFIFSMS